VKLVLACERSASSVSELSPRAPADLGAAPPRDAAPPSRRRSRGPARSSVAIAACSPCDLARELLRALGGRRLSARRTQPLAHLRLESRAPVRPASRPRELSAPRGGGRA
jgi:hypothetical protein